MSEPTEAFFRVKKGVNLGLLHPGLVFALPQIALIVWEVTGRICVFTSGRDGKHSKGSDHYLGRAIDLRTWYWFFKPSKVRELERRLKEVLEPLGWFVLRERTHIHLSYRGGAYLASAKFWRPKAGAAPHEEDL